VSQSIECRQCTSCFAMFFDEYSNKGLCPAGGAHRPGEHQFELPVGLPETAQGQSNWWVCTKCVALFYNGYSDAGVCPAKGAHEHWPKFDFLLAYNVAATSSSQTDWRYCGKCKSLFFDGQPSSKGRCPAGGGHVSEGLTFTLPFFAGYTY
jgi:hypothetical protein